VVAAADFDVLRLAQDHLPFAAHSITVMITAMVPRDLALPAPSGGGLAALVGLATSATTCGALRFGDVKLGALLEPPQR
jgi:hypothetical protein